MRVSPQRRVARSLAGSALSTFAALGSHVLAGAHLPSLVGIAVPLGLAFVICFHLAGRTLSLTRLSAAVLASQGVFHLLFSWGTVDATVTGDAAAHHLEPGALTVTAAHAGHGGPGMAVAHLAAAIATIAAIHRADALWRTLSRATDRLLSTHLRVPPPRAHAPSAPPRRVAPTRAPLAAPRLALSEPAILRGPPALSLQHSRPA